MCETCGCGGEGGYSMINPADHDHQYYHDHHIPHHHDHGETHQHAASDHHEHSSQTSRINIGTDVLQQNNLLAQRNRGFFEARNIKCLNLVSSPGSGKTTLLEKTIRSLKNKNIYVIEGDQQTTLDADRIKETGVPVIQVNTGNGCHLDAEMIHRAVKELDPANHSLLLIENVGNLVCPALFDLGEEQRVVILSVTEGEDKPLKYPNMFQSAQLCLINKTDLLPYVDFSMEKFRENALKVNPQISFIPLSAKTGEGFQQWIDFLS